MNIKDLKVDDILFDHKVIVETHIIDQLEGVNCTIADVKIFTKDKVSNKVVELRENLDSSPKNKNTI